MSCVCAKYCYIRIESFSQKDTLNQRQLLDQMRTQHESSLMLLSSQTLFSGSPAQCCSNVPQGEGIIQIHHRRHHFRNLDVQCCNSFHQKKILFYELHVHTIVMSLIHKVPPISFYQQKILLNALT